MQEMEVGVVEFNTPYRNLYYKAFFYPFGSISIYSTINVYTSKGLVKLDPIGFKRQEISIYKIPIDKWIDLFKLNSKNDLETFTLLITMIESFPKK